MHLLLTVVVGLVAAVGLLWLVLLVGVALLHPEGSTLRDAARIVPDTVRLVHRLARDHSLRRGVRIRLLLLLAYLAFAHHRAAPCNITMDEVRIEPIFPGAPLGHDVFEAIAAARVASSPR